MDKLIRASLIKHICSYLNLDEAQAEKLCLDYYHQYGSTICGLMKTTDIKARKFVQDVHKNLDLSCILPNPRLNQALQKLSGRKFVFTNGSYFHGMRICKKLGIEHNIDGFFGAQSADFIPKPDPRAFREFFEHYQILPQEAAFFDDSMRNLETIHNMGTKTIWVAPSQAELSQNQNLPSYVDFATADLTSFLENIRV